MTPDEDKLEVLNRLRQALEDSEHAAEPLFDRTHELEKAKVRRRALRLLDQRARSEAELRRRLLDAEQPEPLVEEVIADLCSAGLLNDREFAAQWVHQRHQRRGKSRKVLEMELREKGIGHQDRIAALSAIDDRDERSMAAALARKKARTIREIPEDRQQREKLLARIVGVLARRGYPADMCLSEARRALDERSEELSGTD